jgi:hypothetical protein
MRVRIDALGAEPGGLCVLVVLSPVEKEQLLRRASEQGLRSYDVVRDALEVVTTAPAPWVVDSLDEVKDLDALRAAGGKVTMGPDKDGYTTTFELREAR